MKITLKQIETDQDIASSYDIMKQLRSGIDQDDYINYINKMRSHQKQYTLIVAFSEDTKPIGLVGFSYDFRLSVKGKMIYIEDLVVDQNHQNLGIGKKLMNYAEDIAKKQKINVLVLDSAIHRKAAHKLYEELNFINTSNNYKKFIT